MKIILVLILVLFILLIIKTCIKKYKDYLVNKKFNNYRLGDMIKTGTKRGYIVKGSFAEKYLQLIKHENKKKLNYDILQKILDESDYKDKPGEKDLVVHLRLGDGIKDFKNGKFIQRKHKSGWRGVTDINKLKKFIKKNIKNFDRVVLLYGIHKVDRKKKNIKNSKRYLHDLYSFFNKNKIPFIRYGGNPDQDFAFMCKSKHFVKSGGGFSWIAEAIVKRNNGITYNLL